MKIPYIVRQLIEKIQENHYENFRRAYRKSLKALGYEVE
jgi:hypothetical protein